MGGDCTFESDSETKASLSVHYAEREREEGIRVLWHVAKALILIIYVRCSQSISCTLKHIPICLSFLIRPLVRRLCLSLVKVYHSQSVFLLWLFTHLLTHWLTHSLSLSFHILFTPHSSLKLWFKLKGHVVSVSVKQCIRWNCCSEPDLGKFSAHSLVALQVCSHLHLAARCSPRFLLIFLVLMFLSQEAAKNHYIQNVHCVGAVGLLRSTDH